jgi:preprotein translocase subunit YajC
MTILLQAAGGGASTIIMMVGIMAVFYFFMIRPQQTKAKEQQAFINALKEGDKVVTAGGEHGKIISVRDKTVVLEIDSAKGVRVVYEKTSISKDASAGLNA